MSYVWFSASLLWCLLLRQTVVDERDRALLHQAVLEIVNVRDSHRRDRVSVRVISVAGELVVRVVEEHATSMTMHLVTVRPEFGFCK